jgi:hypothetical protein
MARAAYRVMPFQGGWGVDHNGTVAGPYISKEAAFEVAVGSAMNAIKQGDAIDLSVPGRDGESSALGARTD